MTTADTPPGISRACTPSRRRSHLDWFEVLETRGHLEDGKIAHWQVKLKVAFRLEG